MKKGTIISQVSSSIYYANGNACGGTLNVVNCRCK